ncbi:MAG: SUMF1/EgtB/PvdO family nonheme iron enzyme [Acidimicrobiia bacterium]|nr:SUMF1/EgtB/PvdO family nonheme iron enzyme [Acidimicrobiia bacterium]
MDLDEWVPTERLAGWVGDATDALLTTIADFDDDDPRWVGPYLPTVNPPIWEIAHAAWFAEWFVLRQLHGDAALMADVDARYDSAAVPHVTRWQLAYPDAGATRGYVRHVGRALADRVLDDGGLDSTAYYTLYAVMHHDAHTEALTYTRQTLGWSPPPDRPRVPVPAAAGGDRDLEVAGGRLLLGASRTQPFVMDNERWAHPVAVAAFSMAAEAVTMDQFRAFVADGGYQRAELWSPDGWAWRHEVGAAHPVYWRQDETGWQHRCFDEWRAVDQDADLAMVHVNWWEAQAYCTWAGRRLPTEAEWERAATTGADGVKQWWYPWGPRDAEPDDAALDGRSGGVVPVAAFAAGDGPWGHRQLIGNVWEWTASTFEPFPHFEPDAYRDNSEPWFHTRKVLRGGSWATRARYVRSTFRNYFEPDRRDVFAGFRTCAVD